MDLSWVIECLGVMYFVGAICVADNKPLKAFFNAAALLVIGIVCFQHALYLSATVLVIMGTMFLRLLTMYETTDDDGIEDKKE